MKRILLIDSLNVLFTLYHRKSNGKVWKFYEDLRTIVYQFGVHRVLMAAEGGRSKYRLSIHPGYKEDRIKRREQEPQSEKDRLERFLKEEVADVYSVAEMLGIQIVKVQGAEADDVIARVVNALDYSEYQLMIMSSDTDLHQLLRSGVVQSSYGALLEYLDAGKKIPGSVWINSETFTKEKGVTPKQYALVKSLAGDTADSIPSPKGLGETTALRLIEKYGDLDTVESELKNNFEGVVIPRFSVKVKQALLDEFHSIRRNRLLIELDHSPEEVLGEDGVKYVSEVLDNLEQPVEHDVDKFTELCYECGQLDLVERMDFWLHPFK